MAGPGSPGSDGPTFAPPPLPAGWIAQWDAASKRYYFVQLSTGKSQWETPTEAAPTGVATPGAGTDHPYGAPGRTADGAEIIVHPDGSQTAKYPDGRMEPVHPREDGSTGTRGMEGPSGDRGLGVCRRSSDVLLYVVCCCELVLTLLDSIRVSLEARSTHSAVANIAADPTAAAAAVLADWLVRFLAGLRLLATQADTVAAAAVALEANSRWAWHRTSWEADISSPRSPRTITAGRALRTRLLVAWEVSLEVLPAFWAARLMAP